MKKVLLILFFVQFLFATTPPKKGAIPPHLREQFKKIQEGYNEGYWAEKFQKRFETISKYGIESSKLVLADTVNVPVIFGSYSDVTAKYPMTTFQQMLFDGPNPTRTLTEFYTEISYGKMFMTGTCLGWYKLPRTHGYYVHDGGDRNAGLVYGGADFVIDAMILSDSTVDYSKYVASVDANYAYVPYVGVYHTGADAASGADNIWSHRSNVRWRLNQRKTNDPTGLVKSANVLSDGKYKTNDTYQGKPVVISGDYAIQPELAGSNNGSGNPKQIGVTAHEFGHIFGLPDLYDTDNSSAGIGNWCLMAGGSYGADGSHEAVPAHMSAWCKEKLGWVTPTVLTDYSPQIIIPYIEKYPEIYKVYPKGIPGNEYFLIENRQKFGFDTYLLNSGVLIWHIDNAGTQSNENRRKVDLEQADGLRQLNTSTTRGDAGDPFPGSSNNRNFDGYTNPSSVSNLNLQTYVGVRKISNSDTMMTANFDMGTRPYVVCKSINLKEFGTSNNNNGRLDPGEVGTLELNLENVYPQLGNDLSVSVSTNSSDVQIDSAQKKFSINSLEKIVVKYEGLVKIKSTQPIKNISFIVTIASTTETLNYTFEKQIGYPKILIVNADSVLTENITERYYLHLNKYGKNFEVIPSTEINSLAQKERDIIIWTTGRKKVNTISDAEGDSLIKFLNRGGRLFINSQNVAEDLKNRNSNLSANILKTSFSKNVVFGRTLFGIANDMFGKNFPKFTLGGGGGIGNVTSPDELLIDTNLVHPIFRWNNETTGGYGGLWWEHLPTKSKVVYWTFGLETLNDSTAGQTTSYQAFSAIMNWFHETSSSPEIAENIIPKSIKLFDNYPNPFNPTTAIKFSLPTASEVKLIVRDLLGREIAILVNGKLNAGEHKINFDATNLSTGIYLYTLEFSGKQITKKMMLVK